MLKQWNILKLSDEIKLIICPIPPIIRTIRFVVFFLLAKVLEKLITIYYFIIGVSNLNKT